MKRHLAKFLCLALLMLAKQGLAADGRDAPTLRAALVYGPTTYKSELVASNDTSFSMAYSINVLAGDEKNLGVGIRSDSNVTAFALSLSEITTTWQDTLILYNFHWAYIGAVITNLSMKTVKEEVDLFELVGQGYGGNMGCKFAFGRSGEFHLDITSAAVSTVTEMNQVAVTYGSRLDIDIGASVDITKRALDFVFGYKQRTVPVTTPDVSATETITTTYLGFQLALAF